MNPLSLVSVNNYHFLRGGSDQYYLALNDLLESHGHRVHPFSTRNEVNLPHREPGAWIDPIRLDHPRPMDLVRYLYSPKAASSLLGFLSRHRVQLAHLHIYYGQLTASILEPLRSAGVPIVQTLHEYKTVCPVYTLVSNGEICEACQGGRFWQCMRKRCNRGSRSRSLLSMMEAYVSRVLGAVSVIDQFITVSDFQRHKLMEMGVPGEKLTTIHNFTHVPGTEPSWKPGEYMLYFGRMERVKGVMTLVEAMKGEKDIPLLLAGTGEACGELQAYVRDHRLHHVHWLGFKKGMELEELIRNSVCTVAPSQWYETFGLTLIESFSHGRPVIAGRMGGMTEIVSDGIDGFLVPARDPEALRDRIRWMWEHKKDAVEMGRAGRLKMLASFSPEVHYAKILELYGRML